jgi:hypothetical protein
MAFEEPPGVTPPAVLHPHACVCPCRRYRRGFCFAAAHRTQADALEIEAGAKRRLADEYDAAQERGEIANAGNPNFSEREKLPGWRHPAMPAKANLLHQDSCRTACCRKRQISACRRGFIHLHVSHNAAGLVVADFVAEVERRHALGVW